MLCCPSCSVIGTTIILKLSTYSHRLLAGRDCSAVISQPNRKKYSYFEVISLKIEKYQERMVFFLFYMTIARRHVLGEKKLSRVNLSFKLCLIRNFLVHSLGPILFSPSLLFTPCDNSAFVSKIKMISPVLKIFL